MLTHACIVFRSNFIFAFENNYFIFLKEFLIRGRIKTIKNIEVHSIDIPCALTVLDSNKNREIDRQEYFFIA